MRSRMRAVDSDAWCSVQKHCASSVSSTAALSLRVLLRTHLELQLNPLGDAGAGHLEQLLKMSSTLSTLNIWDIKIGPEGYGNVCAGAAASVSLK